MQIKFAVLCYIIRTKHVLFSINNISLLYLNCLLWAFGIIGWYVQLSNYVNIIYISVFKDSYYVKYLCSLFVTAVFWFVLLELQYQLINYLINYS